MINKNNILSQVIINYLKSSKVGLLIKNIDSINPEQVILDICTNQETHSIFVSCVGYDISGIDHPKCTFDSTIESSVEWRSNPDCAGKIITFVKDDSPKLHSLADFDIITNTDLSNFVAQQQKEHSENQPTKMFWEKLPIILGGTYSYKMLEDFVNVILQNEGDTSLIGENLWILNLLPDNNLLSNKNDISLRLKDNYEKIIAIGQLSEDSRKRLSRSLMNVSEDEKNKLQTAYNNLQTYFKFGKRESLKELNYDLVRILLSAAKKKAQNKPNNGESTPQETTPKPINPKELDSLVSDILTNGDEEDIKDLQEIATKLDSIYTDEQSDSSTISGVGGKFEERTINLSKQNESLRKIVGQACSNIHWGGQIITEETVLKDIIASDDNIFEFFAPDSKDCKLLNFDKSSSLFDFIQRFDIILNDEFISFKEILNELVRYRKELLLKIDQIMYHPILYFGVDLALRESLINYIETWGKLYKHFCENSEKMRASSSEGTDYIAKSLLLLDVLFIKTPKEWKALLLPMHTMYLWRYYEIFKNFAKDKSQLTEKEKEVLSQVLSKLPNVLNYVVVNKILIQNGDEITLPCSGAIDMLPSFENKTNRYLGEDGIQSIYEILSRWIGFAPYTRNEVRICVVDIPSLIVVIREIKKFLDTSICERIVLDVYFTRSQNGNSELAKLDFCNQDNLIGKDIKDDKIQITIHNLDTINDVKDYIEKHPVHIAFFFDQYKYAISYVPNSQNLYINPLVISYDYQFDAVTGKGKLYPSTDSESGIIGDYHKLLRTARVIDSTTCPSVVQTETEHIQCVSETLTDNFTQWLVVADRDTSNYAPLNGIPIGEMQYEKRTVCVWTSSKSRIISQYETLLREYNLNPQRHQIIEVLSRYGHIASTGLISIPKIDFNKQSVDNKRKGLLGTLFASVWYSKRHNGALVASLDDAKSRIWLKSDDDNTRADLIGLYYTPEDDTLHIQSIEVKTRDENPDASYDSNRIISGHAADQIASVIKILTDIFSDDETNISDMFVSARREVLKYQIVSECFMSIHSRDWQQKWTHILKRAFTKNKLDINIEISGILVFINLSSSNNGLQVQCNYDDIESYPIEFVQLNSPDIQRIVFEEHMGESSFPNESISETIDKQSIIGNSQEEDNPIDKVVESKNTSEETEHIVKKEEDIKTESESGQETAQIIEVKENSVINENIGQLVSDFIRSCQNFNINLQECESDRAIIGPSLIRVPFKLRRGQSLSKLQSCLEDISREIRRTGILIQQPRNTDELYLDIPRLHRDQVLYSDVVDKIPTIKSPEELFFPLGRTPEGNDIIKNLSDLPHLLVGGSTGSGKTVFLFTLIMSLLKNHPNKEDLQLILSSSKLEDFSLLGGIPHLYSGKIISDAQEAIDIISRAVVEESEKRMNLLTNAHVSNIKEYNAISDNKMHPIVVIIDEFADLVDQLDSKAQKDEFYRPVQRIAQTGRSRGIHLIVCTQRPEAKLVPSAIKAQLNGRIALRVNDAISSRMIIDMNGGESLQKHGDLIFKNADEKERCQGYLITSSEIQNMIEQYKR